MGLEVAAFCLVRIPSLTDEPSLLTGQDRTRNEVERGTTIEAEILSNPPSMFFWGKTSSA